MVNLHFYFYWRNCMLIWIWYALFYSITNTFGTMPTGGFNPRNASIAYYDNVVFEIIIMIFMFISAVNFSLHYKFLHGDKKIHLKDPEFLFFTSIVLISTLLVTLQLRFSIYDSLLSALRYASFQVVSIVTTTGFVTTDYSLWPPFSQLVLVLLMFLGGCVGSTAGAIKSVRLLLLLKQSKQSFDKLLHPHAIIPMRLGGKVISDDIMPVSYTHLRAHETRHDLVCRLLLEKKKKQT